MRVFVDLQKSETASEKFISHGLFSAKQAETWSPTNSRVMLLSGHRVIQG